MDQVILHLTDLHFGWDSLEQGKKNERELSLRGLLKTIESLPEDWKPTIVCLSGDIGWAGNAADYVKAKEWLDKLLHICRLNYDCVAVCAGNHDIERIKTRVVAIPSTVKDADKVLGLPLSIQLVDLFASYSNFCESANIIPYRIDGKESYLVGEKEINGIRFVAFNTSWYCQDDEDKGKLWLGYPHMRSLDAGEKFPSIQNNSESIFTVTLMHHPFEWIRPDDIRADSGRPNPKDYLAHRSNLLLTGHEHAELRQPDRIAEVMYHFKGAATYAGSSHNNGFHLLKIKKTEIEYNLFAFDPSSTNNEWRKKDSGILEFKKKIFSESNVKLSTKEEYPHQLNNVPYFSGEFFGRVEEMVVLESALITSSRIVLMNGLGGIGKTTLAKWFINQKLQNYDHVAWISVTKEDLSIAEKRKSGSIKESIATDYVLFNNLKIAYNPQQEDINFRFNLVMNALRNLSGQNLLIIDNVGSDIGEKDIKDALPQFPTWKVLITSRQVQAGFHTLFLDKLNPTDARVLFTCYYKHDCSIELVNELLEIVNFHTLTIELFAKTLASHYGALSVEQLLKKVKLRELNDPDLQRKIETNHSTEETEIFRHLILAFDISNLDLTEIRLLTQFTLLPPDAYKVHEQLEFWLGYNNPADRRILNETITSLVKKGWLQENKGSYEMHRLVHQLVSYQQTLTDKEVGSMVRSLSEIVNPRNYNSIKDVWPLLPIGDFFIRSLPEELVKKHPIEIIALRNHVGVLYEDLGMYKQAIDFLEPALTIAEKYFLENHPSISTTQSNLAHIYGDLGNYSMAASLLEKALSSDEINLGREDPIFTLRQSNLAMVYKKLGRSFEASDLLEEALNTTIKFYKKEHSEIAIKQSNLATIYEDLGRYNEAAELLTKALASDRKNLGENHLNVATKENNLGRINMRLKNYPIAATLFKHAFSIVEAYYDRAHPMMVGILLNQAEVSQIVGRLEEARGFLERAQEIATKFYDSDHPTVNSVRSNLANIYYNLRLFPEGVKVLEELIESDEKRSNGKIVQPLNQLNLAILYFELGKKEKAKTLFILVKDFFTKLDNDSPYLKICTSYLSRLS